MYEPARRNAVNSLILGGVLLAYGFLTSPVHLVEDVGLHNTMVDLLFVVLRGGGAAFIVIGALLYAGLRFALLIDAVVVGLCGLILAACGVYWIVTEGPGIQDVLYLIFGVLFLRAGVHSFGAYRKGDTLEAPLTAPATDGAQSAAPAEPVHPASIRPDSLPPDGEVPPDGYLSALSKEKGEPPDASHR